MGKKKENKGILMVVEKNERKVRIEVGYGMEGVMKDEIQRIIINGKIIKEFRRGKYQKGIVKGVDGIIQVI